MRHLLGQYSHQEVTTNAEAFISHASVANMVVETLTRGGRIDPTGAIQPLEVHRRLHGTAKWLIGPAVESEWRTGIVIPPDDQCQYIATDSNGVQTRNAIRWSTEAQVYSVLTGQNESVTLSENAVAKLRDDQAELEKALNDSVDCSAKLSDEQIHDAYHIKKNEVGAADFADTRLYVSAGLGAMGLVRRMVEAGADFSYVKAWVPVLSPGGNLSARIRLYLK